MHPEDDRFRDLVGKRVILPLTGRAIPVVADEYSDPEKGSGAVKITPAHDFGDFDVGKRHDLPQINIFGVEAKLQLKDNADFVAGVPKSADLDATLAMHGADRFAARRWAVRRHRAQFRPQQLDVRIHRAVEARARIFPRRRHQLLARKHPSRFCRQRFQQAKLIARQLERRAAKRDRIEPTNLHFAVGVDTARMQRAIQDCIDVANDAQIELLGHDPPTSCGRVEGDAQLAIGRRQAEVVA